MLKIPGLKEDDVVEVYTRRHFMAFLPQVLFIFLLAVLPIVVIYIFYRLQIFEFNQTSTLILIVISSVYFLLLSIIALAEWISFYYDILLVTGDTLVDIEQLNLFSRHISQLNLIDIEDVSTKVHGLVQTLFNFGDIRIQTAGTRENPTLYNVPNPQKVGEKIIQLHNALVEQEGGHLDLIRTKPRRLGAGERLLPNRNQPDMIEISGTDLNEDREFDIR